MQGKRRPIRKQVQTIVLLISVVSLLLTSLIGTFSMLKIKNDSEASLVSQVEQHLNSIECVSVFHAGNIKIGNLFADTDLLRPDIVPFTIYRKDRSIQRKCFKRKFIFIRPCHFALFDPWIFHRVLPLALQHIRTECPDVILVGACIVNVPFPKQIVQLRCPDMNALRTTLMLVPDFMLRRCL